MPFYFTPYIILPLFSAVVNACLAGFARRRRHVPAALPLFWLMVGMSGWSLAYALNTAATILAPYPQLKDLLTGGADVREGYVLDEGVSNRSWHVIKTRIESGDNLHGWIIALRDITTLRQAQEELQATQTQLKELNLTLVQQVEEEKK